MNYDRRPYKRHFAQRQRPKKRLAQNRRKFTMMIVSLILLLCVSVGGTIALIITHTGDTANTFTPGKISCEVIEPGWEDNVSTVKENVTVKNSGDCPVYIRAAIIVSWAADGDSTSYSALLPVENTDYTLKLGSGWIKGSDGYYYCATPVEKNAESPVFIETCEVISSKDGYHLSVEVLADAIQSSPSKAVEENWNVTVDLDGNITPNN